MLNNQTRRQILSEARQTGFQGSVLDLFQLAEQGADVSGMLQTEAQARQQQQQMQVAQTAKEQEVGLREEHARGNTDASMAFPDVAPNQAFNTEGMKVPINISKVDEQGHLVQSFNNVPPGIKNLPTGPKRGTIIETPAYKNGGYKGYKQKYQNAGFKPLFPGAGNLDVRGLMNQTLNNQNTSLDTNPAAAVQQNNAVTENLNTENKELYNQTISNINTKKANNEQLNASEIAVTKAGPNAQFDTKNTIKKVTDMQTASLPENQGKFKDVVMENMKALQANSFLTSQIASGYGKGYVNQALEDPATFEENYDNLLSGTGQKTMQKIALSSAGVGAGMSSANNFFTRALSYPTSKVSQGIQKMITNPLSKKTLGTALGTMYNMGYVTGVPELLGKTAEAVVGGVAGERSKLDTALTVGKNALNYLPSVKGFNKLGSGLVNNYGKIKTIAKAGLDVYRGNNADAALRMTELVGGGNSKYFKKYARKLLPKDFKNKITTDVGNVLVPPAVGGQFQNDFNLRDALKTGPAINNIQDSTRR